MTIARRALWASGLPARAVLIAMVRAYRATLSGVLGGRCRFYPSCSSYAEQAVRSRGAVIGTTLSIWRILRCNPFGSGGIEPVPDRRTKELGTSHLAYEDVIHDTLEEVSA